MAIGINAAGIEKIRTSMIEYQKYVYNKSYMYTPNAELQAAFKGAKVEKDIINMTQEIQSKINDQTTRIMVDFENRIRNVVSTYQKQDSSSTAVTNVTNSIKS